MFGEEGAIKGESATWLEADITRCWTRLTDLHEQREKLHEDDVEAEVEEAGVDLVT